MDKKTIAAYKKMGIKVSLGTPEQAAQLGTLMFLRGEHRGARKMITLEKAKELLGVKELPGTEKAIKEMLETTQELIDRHGEQWIRDNKKRLLWEWEEIVHSRIMQ